jgi:hypothetical protein
MTRRSGTATRCSVDNYRKGEVKIGRERLPVGCVAILNDADLARLAIGELCTYAIDGRGKAQQRLSIVFRICEDVERQRLVYRMHQIHGVDWCNANGLPMPCRRWHIVDSEHLLHICNRHSDALIEQRHGQLPITPEDISRILDIVQPSNVVEFVAPGRGGCPRIVYEKVCDTGQITLVQEVQARTGFVVKTMYKVRVK